MQPIERKLHLKIRYPLKLHAYMERNTVRLISLVVLLLAGTAASAGEKLVPPRDQYMMCREAEAFVVARQLGLTAKQGYDLSPMHCFFSGYIDHTPSDRAQAIAKTEDLLKRLKTPLSPEGVWSVSDGETTSGSVPDQIASQTDAHEKRRQLDVRCTAKENGRGISMAIHTEVKNDYLARSVTAQLKIGTSRTLDVEITGRENDLDGGFDFDFGDGDAANIARQLSASDQIVFVNTPLFHILLSGKSSSSAIGQVLASCKE